ncbi:MAG: choice-of-anchor D domain-containing protein, partial [Candidatus Krumholzibacteria bacterium]|nr:choice-of-anchor D domain-containing protein [Candidatus Krumholzibacteria bacterium]
LVLEGDNDSTVPIYNSILSALGAGIVYDAIDGADGTTSFIFPHQTTENVGSIYLSANIAHLSTLSLPAHYLINDDLDVPNTAYSEVGVGRIIAMADEVFINSRMGMADNQLFANQVFDWLAGGVGWLAVSPSEGTVPPDSTDEVTVTYDATRLNGDDYFADVIVQNNDPLSPEVTVPAYLHVTGAPDVTVSDTLLAYGPVFIDGSVSDTLVVSNKGTDLLTVSSITTDDGDYSVDVASFALNPDESQDVVVTFAPTRTGMIPATLTIISNDPDEPVVTVELTGEGLEPPIISVSPDSFADSLFTGAVATQTMTIFNTGGSDLTFDLSIVEPDTTPASPNATASSDIPHLDLGKGEVDPRVGPPVVLASGGPDGFGYRWIDSDEPGGPVFNWVDISGVGTPLFLGDDGSQLVSLPFVFSFYGVDQTSAIISANGYLTFGTNGSSYSNQPIPNPASPNDMIAAFWDDLFPGGGGPVYYYYDAPGNRFIVQYQNVPHYSGGGPYTFEVILNANGSILFQYLTMNSPVNGSTTGIENATGTDGLQVAFNTDYVHDNLAVRFSTAPAWLSVDPGSGTVPPGMSMDVDVTFDAAGLNGGDYYSDIVVANNDPLNSEWIVPAHLNVTGAPDISVSDTLLAFGQVFIGGTVLDTVVVKNVGTDLLAVGSVATDHPDYTVDVASFNLNPGESQDIQVTFTPTTAAVILGTLTLQSNDPDAPTVDVALEGEGLIAPVIAVSPDSLAESLFTGDIATHQLTIDNSGGSDLNWLVRIVSTAAEQEYTLTVPDIENVSTNDGVQVGEIPYVRTTPITAMLQDLTDVDIMWDQSHGQGSPSSWTTIMADLTARGATVTPNFDPITLPLLDNYDIVWLIDMGSWTPAEVAVIAAWVQLGGAILFESDQSVTTINDMLTAMGAGIVMTSGGVNGMTSNIFPHETTENVNSVNIPGALASLTQVNPPGGRLVDDINNVGACAYSDVQAGRVVVLNDELFSDFGIGGGDNQLFANQVIDWLAEGVAWLTVNPTEGTTPSGGSDILDVVFDATAI